MFSVKPTAPPPTPSKMNEEHHDEIGVSSKVSPDNDGNIDSRRNLTDQKMHAEFIYGILRGPRATWDPVSASRTYTQRVCMVLKPTKFCRPPFIL